MPFLAPLFGALAGALGTVGAVSIGATTLGAIATNLMVGAALSGAAMLLSKQPSSMNSQLGSTTLTGYGSDDPRRMIYGQTKVGGTIVFQHSSNDATYGVNSSSTPPNSYVHLLIAFAGHEVTSFDKIFFDDNEIVFDTDGHAIAEIAKINAQNFTALVPAGATSAVLCNPWQYATGTYQVTFEDFSTKNVNFTLNSTAVSWTGGLANNVGQTFQITNSTLNQTPEFVYTFTRGDNVFGHVNDPMNKVVWNGVSGLGASYTFTTWNARVNKHTGAAGQTVDSDLNTMCPGMFVPTDVGNNVAYLYVCLRVSTDFNGQIPTITVIISGKKVYDPRTSTTGFSSNTALCIRDYLAGRGADSDELPDSLFIAAANICDELVTKADGTQEPRYTCNGTLDSTTAPVDFINQLAGTMAGQCPYVGGQFMPFAGTWRTPETVGISEADMIDAPTFQTTIQLADLFNGVKGTYICPQNNYQASDFPAVFSNTYMAQDGGRRLWSDLTLAFVASPTQAQRIAKITLLRVRQPNTLSVKLPLHACQFTIGDIVPVTYVKNGWSAKYLEVTDMTLNLEQDSTQKPFLSYTVSFRETDSTIYDWSYNEELASDPAPNTNLPSPFEVPPPTGLYVTSGDADLYTRGDGTVMTRAHLHWVPAMKATVQTNGYYDIQYKLSSQDDTQWKKADQVFGDGSEVYINDVQDGANYDFRMRSVTALGNHSDWTTVLNYTIVGKTQPPAAPTGFSLSIEANGFRRFSFTPPTDSDLAGCIIGYSSDLSAVFSAMTIINTGFLTVSPYETNQVPAGTWKFGIVAIDTSGNMSTPDYMISTIPSGATGSSLFSYQSRDHGWGGTLTNCHVDAGNGNIEADGGTAWSSIPSWDTMGSWNDGCTTPITYEEVGFDLGSSKTFVPSVTGVWTGSSTIQAATSTDGITWGSYASLTTLTTRYFRIKISLATSGSDTPSINTLSIIANAA